LELIQSPRLLQILQKCRLSSPLDPANRQQSKGMIRVLELGFSYLACNRFPKTGLL
jgi:hypothetical protein